MSTIRPVGRDEELNALADVLQERGQAVLYSPRGFGKTELVKLFVCSRSDAVLLITERGISTRIYIVAQRDVLECAQERLRRYVTERREDHLVLGAVPSPEELAELKVSTIILDEIQDVYEQKRAIQYVADAIKVCRERALRLLVVTSSFNFARQLRACDLSVFLLGGIHRSRLGGLLAQLSAPMDPDRAWQITNGIPRELIELWHLNWNMTKWIERKLNYCTNVLDDIARKLGRPRKDIAAKIGEILDNPDDFRKHTFWVDLVEQAIFIDLSEFEPLTKNIEFSEKLSETVVPVLPVYLRILHVFAVKQSTRVDLNEFLRTLKKLGLEPLPKK